MSRRWLSMALAILPFGCVDRVIDGAADGDGDGDGGDIEPDDAGESPQSGDSCEDDSDCAQGSVCFEGTCVIGGEVRVSLSWLVISDFDLHVRTPEGIEVYFGNTPAGGGELDVDDCVGQECRDSNGTHVENVYFGATAPRGEYAVWVQNFDGAGSGAWQIEVAGAVSASWTGELAADQYENSETMTFVWP